MLTESLPELPEGNKMDLQTFISEVLRQIYEGTKDSLEKGVSIPAGIGPDRVGQNVEFDVAVTTVTSTSKKGGAALFVAAIGMGGQATSGASISSISRIKFSIPIRLPSS